MSPASSELSVLWRDSVSFATWLVSIDSLLSALYYFSSSKLFGDVDGMTDEGFIQ